MSRSFDNGKALLVLSVDKTPDLYTRVIATCTPMQNPTGGFGGGHGQMSHSASSYAAVLALAMIGGEDAYRLIDRRGM